MTISGIFTFVWIVYITPSICRHVNVLSVDVKVTCLHIWTDIYGGPNLYETFRSVSFWSTHWSSWYLWGFGMALSGKYILYSSGVSPVNSLDITDQWLFEQFLLTLNSLLGIWSEYIINLNNNLSVSLYARNMWRQIGHSWNDLRWEKMIGWFIFFINASKKSTRCECDFDQLIPFSEVINLNILQKSSILLNMKRSYFL